MQQEHNASSLNARRNKPALRLNIFNKHHHHHHPADGGSTNGSASSSSSTFSATAGILPTPRKSPTAWIRSKAPELPVFKDKYKKFTSRMGHHRRHSSADFSYDPVSYSHNFQDRDDPSGEEDSYRSFTARLPTSPLKSSQPSSSATGTNLSKTVSEITSSNGAAIVPDHHARPSMD